MNFYIRTYGCQQNTADSLRISAFLQSSGLKEVKSLNEADIFIINSCSVRQASEDKVYGLANKVREWKMAGGEKIVILTGCMVGSAIGERRRFPLAYVKKRAPWVDYFWGIDEFEREARGAFRIPRRGVQLNAPTRCAADLYLIPIMSGCDNFCSYCVVPYARGKERSRPFDEVVCEAERAVKNGAKEILLLGQNVNSYGRDFATDFAKNSSSPPCIHVSIHRHKYKEWFPRLLERLNEIDGLEKISFLTSHSKDVSDELIDAIATLPKVSKDVHLPVQSGDDEILRKMNRGYTASDYLKLVAKLRRRVKGLRLSTDIIVGFPGETKAQFENTVKLFKEAEFDNAFIAIYSPREGTAAAKLADNVPLSVKKRRHRVVLGLIQRVE